MWHLVAFLSSCIGIVLLCQEEEGEVVLQSLIDSWRGCHMTFDATSHLMKTTSNNMTQHHMFSVVWTIVV